MKKHLAAVAAIVSFFVITGCVKEVNTYSARAKNVQPEQSKTLPGRDIIKDFFKTPFISQINTTTKTDSSIMVFDFIEKKSFTKGDAGYLLLPYGDGQFISRGWKYKLSVDTATDNILLFPNDTMQSEIVAGSFKTVMATFDLASKTYNFITRFKELNGNKSEVAETVFKKW